MPEQLEIELETMGAVLTALKKLDSAETQIRVVKWVAEKLGLEVGQSAATTSNSVKTDTTGSSSGLSAVATAWLKQNSLTDTEIEVVFHLNGSEADIIAPEIPGKSNREKTLNCYILEGAREFLRTGEATFSDKAARGLCMQFGCFDSPNHAKYISEKGNEFTGSKEKGWALTGPGKKRAAALVKEIAAVLL
jgi:hypothetical protein